MPCRNPLFLKENGDFCAPPDVHAKESRPLRKRAIRALSMAAVRQKTGCKEHAAAVGSHGAAASRLALGQRVRGGRLAHRCVAGLAAHSCLCSSCFSSSTASSVFSRPTCPWHLCLCCISWKCHANFECDCEDSGRHYAIAHVASCRSLISMTDNTYKAATWG